MRKSTAIYTGFIALALAANGSVSAASFGNFLAEFITPSQYAVEYYFPPETQEGVTLEPNTHNYVSCTKDGTPSLLQPIFADDADRTYWIREEPPQFSRSNMNVRGNAPTTMLERGIGGLWRFLTNGNGQGQSSSTPGGPPVSDDEKVHFYSAGALALHPELASESTLETFKGGTLYYVKTEEDLEFVCPEGLLCGDGECEEGESALICPEDEPCRKSCEADCSAAPAVQDFCLPCGESCQDWHLGDVALSCGANVPGISCEFVNDDCTRTDIVVEDPDPDECATSLLTDLVSHWKLDEPQIVGEANYPRTISDAHGSYDLTEETDYQNSGISTMDGHIGLAMNFETSGNERLKSSDTALSIYDTQDTGFTVAFWVKDSFGGNGGLIGNDGEYEVSISGGSLEFTITHDNGDSFVQTPISPLATSYSLVTAWFDPSDSTMNIQSGTSQPETLIVSNIDWGVMMSNRFDGEFLLGGTERSGTSPDLLMDSVSFWKRVLTPAERTALYNSGDGLPYDQFASVEGTTSCNPSAPPPPPPPPPPAPQVLDILEPASAEGTIWANTNTLNSMYWESPVDQFDIHYSIDGGGAWIPGVQGKQLLPRAMTFQAHSSYEHDEYQMYVLFFKDAEECMNAEYGCPEIEVGFPQMVFYYGNEYQEEEDIYGGPHQAFRISGNTSRVRFRISDASDASVTDDSGDAYIFGNWPGQQSAPELTIIEPTSTVDWPSDTLNQLRWTAPENTGAFTSYADQFKIEYSFDEGQNWQPTNDNQTVYLNGNDEYQMYISHFKDFNECLNAPPVGGCANTVIGFPQLTFHYGLRSRTNPTIGSGPSYTILLAPGENSISFRITDIENPSLVDSSAVANLDLPEPPPDDAPPAPQVLEIFHPSGPGGVIWADPNNAESMTWESPVDKFDIQYSVDGGGTWTSGVQGKQLLTRVAGYHHDSYEHDEYQLYVHFFRDEEECRNAEYGCPEIETGFPQMIFYYGNEYQEAEDIYGGPHQAFRISGNTKRVRFRISSSENPELTDDSADAYIFGNQPGQPVEVLTIFEPTAEIAWESNTLQTLRWTAPANPDSFVPYADEFSYEYSLDNGTSWIMANDRQTAFRNGLDEYQAYAIIYKDASQCISSPHGCQSWQFDVGFPQMVLFYGLRTQTNPQVAVGQQASFRLPDNTETIRFRIANVERPELTDTSGNLSLDLPEVPPPPPPPPTAQCPLSWACPDDAHCTNLAEGDRKAKLTKPNGEEICIRATDVCTSGVCVPEAVPCSGSYQYSGTLQTNDQLDACGIDGTVSATVAPLQCGECSSCGDGLTNICDADECNGQCVFTNNTLLPGGSCTPNPAQCEDVLPAAGQCSDCSACGPGLNCTESKCLDAGPCEFTDGLIFDSCDPISAICGENTAGPSAPPEVPQFQDPPVQQENSCYIEGGNCPSDWISVGGGCYAPEDTTCSDEYCTAGTCAAGSCICDAGPICVDGPTVERTGVYAEIDFRTYVEWIPERREAYFVGALSNEMANRLNIYSPDTNTLTEFTLPFRYDYSAPPALAWSPIQQKLYLFSGLTGQSTDRRVSTNSTDIYSFDPATQEITLVAQMPKSQLSTTPVYVPSNGKMYLFGGMAWNGGSVGKNRGVTNMNDVTVFNPVDNSVEFVEINDGAVNGSRSIAVWDPSRQKILLSKSGRWMTYDPDNLLGSKQDITDQINRGATNALGNEYGESFIRENEGVFEVVGIGYTAPSIINIFDGTWIEGGLSYVYRENGSYVNQRNSHDVFYDAVTKRAYKIGGGGRDIYEIPGQTHDELVTQAEILKFCVDDDCCEGGTLPINPILPAAGQCSDCSACGPGLNCTESKCLDAGPCAFTDGLIFDSCDPNPAECDDPPPPPGPLCGNGQLDPGEQCDYLNIGCPIGNGQMGSCPESCLCEPPQDGDLCGNCGNACLFIPTTNCTPGFPCFDCAEKTETFTCEIVGTECVKITDSCGNGVEDPGEGCDDENLANGDGCSDSCAVELGWQCNVGQQPPANTVIPSSQPNNACYLDYDINTPCPPGWMRVTSGRIGCYAPYQTSCLNADCPNEAECAAGACTCSGGGGGSATMSVCTRVTSPIPPTCDNCASRSKIECSGPCVYEQNTVFGVPVFGGDCKPDVVQCGGGGNIVSTSCDNPHVLFEVSLPADEFAVVQVAPIDYFTDPDPASLTPHSLPAGSYRVRYKSGAFSYWNNDAASVQYRPLLPWCSYIQIRHSSNTTSTPILLGEPCADGPWGYLTEAEAEAAMVGKSVTFEHTGGNMYLYQSDNNIRDNRGEMVVEVLGCTDVPPPPPPPPPSSSSSSSSSSSYVCVPCINSDDDECVILPEFTEDIEVTYEVKSTRGRPPSVPSYLEDHGKVRGMYGKALYKKFSFGLSEFIGIMPRSMGLTDMSRMSYLPFPSDIDEDGDDDVLIYFRGGASYKQGFFWFENRGPSEEWISHGMPIVRADQILAYRPKQNQYTTIGQEYWDRDSKLLPDTFYKAGGDYRSYQYISSGDIDGDGDSDALLIYQRKNRTGKFVWLENTSLDAKEWVLHDMVESDISVSWRNTTVFDRDNILITDHNTIYVLRKQSGSWVLEERLTDFTFSAPSMRTGDSKERIEDMDGDGDIDYLFVMAKSLAFVPEYLRSKAVYMENTGTDWVAHLFTGDAFESLHTAVSSGSIDTTSTFAGCINPPPPPPPEQKYWNLELTFSDAPLPAALTCSDCASLSESECSNGPCNYQSNTIFGLPVPGGSCLEDIQLCVGTGVLPTACRECFKVSEDECVVIDLEDVNTDVLSCEAATLRANRQLREYPILSYREMVNSYLPTMDHVLLYDNAAVCDFALPTEQIAGPIIGKVDGSYLGFSRPIVLTTDMDGDGDMDALVTSYSSYPPSVKHSGAKSVTTWYENPGDGGEWIPHGVPAIANDVIVNRIFTIPPQDVIDMAFTVGMKEDNPHIALEVGDAIDIDSDGDKDMVAMLQERIVQGATLVSTKRSLVYIENTSDLPADWQIQTITDPEDRGLTNIFYEFIYSPTSGLLVVSAQDITVFTGSESTWSRSDPLAVANKSEIAGSGIGQFGVADWETETVDIDNDGDEDMVLIEKEYQQRKGKSLRVLLVVNSASGWEVHTLKDEKREAFLAMYQGATLTDQQKDDFEGCSDTLASSSASSSSSSSLVEVALCGNGRIDADEVCDGGSDCSEYCTFDECFVEHVIDPGSRNMGNQALGDIDRDGDQDLVFFYRGTNAINLNRTPPSHNDSAAKLIWSQQGEDDSWEYQHIMLENPLDYRQWKQDIGEGIPHLIDLDDDGDLDILMSSMMMLENLGWDTNGEHIRWRVYPGAIQDMPIGTMRRSDYNVQNFAWTRGVSMPLDVNADGYTDLVRFSNKTGEPIAFLHPGNNVFSASWRYVPFAENWTGTSRYNIEADFTVVDMNNDGLKDIVMNLVRIENIPRQLWMENPGNAGKWEWHELYPYLSRIRHMHQLEDGSTAALNSIQNVGSTSTYNMQNKNGWWLSQDLQKGALYLYQFDVNGDGREDLVGVDMQNNVEGCVAFKKVSYAKNENPWETCVPDTSLANLSHWLQEDYNWSEDNFITDFNNDGKLDIVSGSNFQGDSTGATLSWFENVCTNKQTETIKPPPPPPSSSSSSSSSSSFSLAQVLSSSSSSSAPSGNPALVITTPDTPVEWTPGRVYPLRWTLEDTPINTGVGGENIIVEFSTNDGAIWASVGTLGSQYINPATNTFEMNLQVTLRPEDCNISPPEHVSDCAIATGDQPKIQFYSAVGTSRIPTGGARPLPRDVSSLLFRLTKTDDRTLMDTSGRITFPGVSPSSSSSSSSAAPSASVRIVTPATPVTLALRDSFTLEWDTTNIARNNTLLFDVSIATNSPSYNSWRRIGGAGYVINPQQEAEITLIYNQEECNALHPPATSICPEGAQYYPVISMLNDGEQRAFFSVITGNAPGYEDRNLEDGDSFKLKVHAIRATPWPQQEITTAVSAVITLNYDDPGPTYTACWERFAPPDNVEIKHVTNHKGKVLIFVIEDEERKVYATDNGTVWVDQQTQWPDVSGHPVSSSDVLYFVEKISYRGPWRIWTQESDRTWTERNMAPVSTIRGDSRMMMDAVSFNGAPHFILLEHGNIVIVRTNGIDINGHVAVSQVGRISRPTGVHLATPHAVVHNDKLYIITRQVDLTTTQFSEGPTYVSTNGSSFTIATDLPEYFKPPATEGVVQLDSDVWSSLTYYYDKPLARKDNLLVHKTTSSSCTFSREATDAELFRPQDQRFTLAECRDAQDWTIMETPIPLSTFDGFEITDSEIVVSSQRMFNLDEHLYKSELNNGLFEYVNNEWVHQGVPQRTLGESYVTDMETIDGIDYVVIYGSSGTGQNRSVFSNLYKRENDTFVKVGDIPDALAKIVVFNDTIYLIAKKAYRFNGTEFVQDFEFLPEVYTQGNIQHTYSLQDAVAHNGKIHLLVRKRVSGNNGLWYRFFYYNGFSVQEVSRSPNPGALNLDGFKIDQDILYMYGNTQYFTWTGSIWNFKEYYTHLQDGIAFSVRRRDDFETQCKYVGDPSAQFTLPTDPPVVRPIVAASSSSSSSQMALCVFVTEEYDVDHITDVPDRQECETLAATWCPDHIDGKVVYRRDMRSYGNTTYCRGERRSCNLIRTRTATQASGTFDFADSAPECINHFMSKPTCNTYSSGIGLKIEFGEPSSLKPGKVLHVCQGAYRSCKDSDPDNLTAFPGSIATERYPSKKLYASRYPDDSKTLIKNVIRDSCFTADIGLGTKIGYAVDSCAGTGAKPCFVNQPSCIGEDHPPLHSYNVQDQKDAARYPNIPGIWKDCPNGCIQGFCLKDETFSSQFTCTNNQVTTGGHPTRTRLNYIENFLLQDTSQGATDCIKYGVVNLGARKAFLDELIARGESRDLVDQIAAYRLLNQIPNALNPGGYSEEPEWDLDDPISFLEESDTAFTESALYAYRKALGLTVMEPTNSSIVASLLSTVRTSQQTLPIVTLLSLVMIGGYLYSHKRQ